MVVPAGQETALVECLSNFAFGQHVAGSLAQPGGGDVDRVGVVPGDRLPVVDPSPVGIVPSRIDALDGDVPALGDPGAKIREDLLGRVEGDGLGGAQVALPCPEDGLADVGGGGNDVQGLGQLAGDQQQGEGRGSADSGADGLLAISPAARFTCRRSSSGFRRWPSRIRRCTKAGPAWPK